MLDKFAFMGEQLVQEHSIKYDNVVNIKHIRYNYYEADINTGHLILQMSGCEV